jgi:putative endonuclease
MTYVYILRSISWPEQRYFGITSDLKQRLKYHNTGRCPHTSKFMPWNVETYVAFSDEKKAFEFEKYLKSGSGREFSRRRF